MKTEKLILGLLFVAIALVHCCSCVTERKVNRWLNEHPTQAAGYCADKFPPDTTSRVVYGAPDTAAYEAAYWELANYADSLFNELSAARNDFIPTPAIPCPPLVNLDSLRKAVDKEIRKRLAPCKDSIQYVKYTVVDKARETHLQGRLDEKDGVISARDKTITEQGEKIKSQKKWFWLFWALVVVIVGYVLLKLRFKLPI
jgi:hypothetical protein